MIIEENRLVALARDIFELFGCEAAEAEAVARHLVEANMAGHDSHGVALIPPYVDHFREGLVKPGTPAELVRDDGAFLLFDGQLGFGRTVAGECMDAAIARCRREGISIAGLRNAHHIGRIGAYGEMAIANGLIGIHFVNVTGHSPSVVPYAGAEARFVTNPVCIAVPGTGETPPVVLDMATSRIAVGKLRVALNKGEQATEGMLIDTDGNPTTDPAVIFAEPRGALMPFGEHKGSGLALMCEILAGALTGGGTIQPENSRGKGIVNNMLTILVDPEQMVDRDWFAAEVDAIVSYVKSARAADPAIPVRVAGDPERETRHERSANGIPVDDTTWEGILSAGESLGLDRVRYAL